MGTNLASYRTALKLLGDIRRPRAVWARERDANIRRLVLEAYNRNTFYRELMDRHEIDPTRVEGASDLARFPVLTKADLLAAGEKLVTQGRKPLMALHTSGTSRLMGEVKLDQEGLNTVRSLVLYNTLLRGRISWRPLLGRVRILAVLMLGHSTHQLMALTPQWLTRIRYLDIGVSLDEMLDAIRAFRPHVLHAYPSTLLRLARHIEEQGICLDNRFFHVSSFAEMLDERLRIYLERVYQAPINNFYSTVETVLLSKTCPKGRLHLTLPTLLHCDVIDSVTGAASNEGELCVTNLYNRCTPLIRYNLKDLVRLERGLCDCGWTTPLITCLAGRVSTLLRLPDGRTVSGFALSDVPSRVPQVLQMQVVQSRLEEIACRVILDGSNDLGDTLARIENEIRRIIQHPGVRIVVETVSELDTRGPGRKTPAVIPMEHS